MKHNKIIRILAMLLPAILLLVALVPVVPVLAEPRLFVDPPSGKVGDYINAYGNQFYANNITELYFSSDQALVGYQIDYQVTAYQRVKVANSDGLGQINAYFTVPENLADGSNIQKVRSGIYYLYVIYQGDKHIVASVQFLVVRTGQITLSTTEGKVGSQVTITGAGFGSTESFTITLDNITLSITSGNKVTDAAGGFTTNVTIPKTVAGNNHTITVVGNTSTTQATTGFIVDPSLVVSPSSGVVGDTISVSGTGFGGSNLFDVSFAGVDIVTGQITDTDGSFTVTFVIPQQAIGTYKIQASDESGDLVDANFSVTPSNITVSPNSGSVGSTVTVKGSGFQAGKPLSIYFDNELAKTTYGDNVGKFTADITVPIRVSGSYKVKASDGTNTAQVDFAVGAAASISPVTSASSPGNVGSSLTISGSGFTGGKNIAVTFDGTQIGSGPIIENGTFSLTVKVPPSKAGNHTILVTDGTFSKQFTFVMESTSPPTPAPLKPEMDVRASAATTFTWQAVSDPSGVTYTLQVATAADFSASSLVLEKSGINSTTYTLNKTEQLKSISKDTPYYWRVKAVDGASNESQWSGTGTFYVGLVSGIPVQMIIYILIGVGVVGLLILAFFLGRRMAYY